MGVPVHFRLGHGAWSHKKNKSGDTNVPFSMFCNEKRIKTEFAVTTGNLDLSKHSTSLWIIEGTA